MDQQNRVPYATLPSANEANHPILDLELDRELGSAYIHRLAYT